MQFATSLRWLWATVLAIATSRQSCFRVVLLKSGCAHEQAYPYPFLNALPQPGGFIGMAAAGVVGVCLFSRVGALLSKRVSLSGRKAKVDKIL